MYRRFFTVPGWAILSATACAVFVFSFLLFYRHSSTASSEVNASTAQHFSQATPQPKLGPRHQLTYEQWVTLLGREARVVAENPPKRLVILAGDSLSLWFPPELLPQEVTWLNQGISGETTDGLLRRLKLFDATKPEVVLVMIGINDLIRGVRDETLLANQREIFRHLRVVHPHARIVAQSILPHGGESIMQQYQQAAIARPRPVWVDRLMALPNRHIRQLNQRLAQIAQEEKVEYLDLYPSFANAAGDLSTDLSTDGLHLSLAGYRVWRSQLQTLTTPPTETTRAPQSATPDVTPSPNIKKTPAE